MTATASRDVPAPGSPGTAAGSGEYLVPAALAVLGVGVAALALLAPAVRGALLHDVRVVATTAFLLLGPGWAVAGFLHGPLARRVTAAVATSLAVGIAAGQAMAVTGVWAPVPVLLALVAVSVPLLVRHAVRVR